MADGDAGHPVSECVSVVVVDGGGEGTEPIGEVGSGAGEEHPGKLVEAGAGGGAERGGGDVVQDVQGALGGVLRGVGCFWDQWRPAGVGTVTRGRCFPARAVPRLGTFGGSRSAEWTGLSCNRGR